MIDVHPPHEAAHTWKDFLIHIAIIVVGLVIAVGLEQSVEYFHHRHQITETRDALQHERLENYARLDRYVTLWYKSSALQQADMEILTSLQHHPQNASQIAGGLRWSIARNQFETSAWHTAQSSGVLAMLPPDEVLANERVYTALQDISHQNDEEWLALNDATRFLFTDPDPSHLSPAQLSEEITLMQKVMMKQYLRGNFMGYPHTLDTGFVAGPSEHDLHAFHNLPTAADATPEAHGSGSHL
ncbi:MAG: hypothetical protein WBY53_04450 [Acidobacteriaceae bacterium]